MGNSWKNRLPRLAWPTARAAGQRFQWAAALALTAGCQNTAPRDVQTLPPVPASWPAPSVGLNAGAAPAAGEIIPVAAQEAQPPKRAQPQAPELLPSPERVPGPAPGQSPATPEAGAPALTLTQAVATGLLQNPDLVALRGQEEVGRAVVGVARTPLWNPFVQAQYLPSGSPFSGTVSGQPGSGAGLSSFYVWVMQRFQIAHQRQFRTQAALAALSQIQWNIYQAELLNMAQTVRLYFTALYQKELLGMAADNAELSRRLLAVVEQRYRANLARAADVTTARIAARQAQRQEDLADATFQAAVLALRQQLNVPLPTPLALTERLTDYQWSPVGPPPDQPALAGCDLAAELVEGRPDVMAARAGMRVAQANYKLARASRVPDVQFGPIYNTADDGTRYMGMRFQTDIPVWNTGAPLARQRRAEVDQQNLTYGQLKVRAALEAQAGIDRYERARRLAAKGGAAPAAGPPAELQDIIEQFQAGQTDILAVLGTQANLLQERRIALDMLNELAQAAANVVQATALPPDRLVSRATATTKAP
jgi:cobalt-zinc-cadmium efflux system outer membrane protein